MIWFTLAALSAGCGSDSGQSANKVKSFEELDAALAAAYEAEEPDTLELLPGRFEVAYGDLPEIEKRGVIRALVSPSRTNYFYDWGKEKGFEYELLRAYEKSLDKRTRGRFVMAILPVSFDQLLPYLAAGRGDIAAAGLTVTPDREDSVSFAAPYFTDVSEVVVGRDDGIQLASLDDLAGREVTVVRGSSYQNHLLALNERLEAQGLERITVTLAPAYVESEDLLELVENGLLELTVVDSHLAHFWTTALPHIVAYNDFPLETGGSIAWAVRKDDEQLRKDISSFVQSYKKGSRIGNILFARYMDQNKWVLDQDHAVDEEMVRKRALVQKYAKEYGFDWLLLAALAYQESDADHSVRSRAGAVGLLQIKPAVAAAEPIGIKDVTTLDGNIHAGVKYLALLRDHYLDDPDLTDVARTDFVLASYNAGPTRIRKLRELAKSKGYDPNRWFDNVERLAPRQTVDYVAHINRHYYSMRLAVHSRDQRNASIDELSAQ